MPEFRKKHVIIESLQYNNLNKSEIEEFLGVELKQELESETAYLAGQGAPVFSLIIETSYANLKAMPYDYFVKDVDGEFVGLMFLKKHTVRY